MLLDALPNRKPIDIVIVIGGVVLNDTTRLRVGVKTAHRGRAVDRGIVLRCTTRESADVVKQCE